MTTEYTICLDIGFRNTGVVVYDNQLDFIADTDCIRNQALKRKSKAKQHWDECQALSEHLNRLFRIYPDSRVFVESPSGGAKSAKAIKTMASCVAILSSVCVHNYIPVTLFTPIQLKRLVRSRGIVSKEDIISLVEEKLTCIGFKYPNKYKWCMEHVADAGAILLVANEMRLLNLTLTK